MKHVAPSLAIFLLVAVHAFAAGVPKWWIRCEYDRDSAVFVGRGYSEVSAGIQQGDLEAKARADAVVDAAQGICSRVTVETASMTRETGEGANGRVEQFFESRNEVKTLLRRVPNVRVLQREVQPDRAYILVGISRDEVLRAYRQDLSILVERVVASAAAAEGHVGVSPLDALKGYGAALLLHEEIEECCWMVTSLGGTNVTPAVMVPERIGRSHIEQQMRRLEAGMSGLLQAQLVSEMADAVRPAATGAVTFCVYPLTYGRTDAISPFGDRLTELVAVEFGKAGWVRQNDPAKASVWFSGRVVDCGDGVQVVLQRLRQDGGIEAATQRFVGKDACERLKLGAVKPENWTTAGKDALAFQQGRKVLSGLSVDLRIVGMPADVPVLLREDDRPVLEIRATRDCSVRIVHVFGDNTKSVLIDDMVVPAGLANQWIRVPVKLRITPPFGVEQVLVQAAADGVLPAIKTRVELVTDAGGNPIGRRAVVDGDLKSELVRLRGSVLEAVFSETVYTWSVRAKVE